MKKYTEIDQRIHQLSQTIAKANRTFISAKADDSHTNLCFDSVNNRICGRWISAKADEVILTLNLKLFRFEWMNKSLTVIHTHEIANKTLVEIEGDIFNFLPKLGLQPEGFLDALHYDIPAYSFVKNKFEKWNDSDIQLWEKVRTIANDSCQDLVEKLEGASEIRIWPHHFDTGIYMIQHQAVGIGFGLAMNDGLLNEPYFYTAGYSLNGGEIDYKSAPELTYGKWVNQENWKGAVLPLSQVDVSTGEPVLAFGTQTTNWLKGK